jgi:hypothetical protein
MKIKRQSKKEFVIMHFDDYLNEWKVWSIPLTIRQASAIMLKKNPQYYRIDAI